MIGRQVLITSVSNYLLGRESMVGCLVTISGIHQTGYLFDNPLTKTKESLTHYTFSDPNTMTSY